jgi:hypothetical protein
MSALKFYVYCCKGEGKKAGRLDGNKVITKQEAK